MFFNSRPKGAKYEAELADMGESLQLGIYLIIESTLRRVDDQAGEIAAGVSNYLARFGDYGPLATIDTKLKAKINNMLSKLKTILSEDQKDELTSGVAIWGAVQKIDMPEYSSHVAALNDLGILNWKSKFLDNFGLMCSKTDLKYHSELVACLIIKDESLTPMLDYAAGSDLCLRMPICVGDKVRSRARWQGDAKTEPLQECLVVNTISRDEQSVIQIQFPDGHLEIRIVSEFVIA